MRRRLASRLARVRLHAVRTREETGTGARVVAKRRTWPGRLLIGPGNLYLRWLGAGVTVLPQGRWLERECAIYPAVHGAACRVEAGGWLVMPAWPGVPLATFAADVGHPIGERLGALGAAAAGLRDLHRTVVGGMGGEADATSHGDATLRNVMYDPATGSARWFDFDTAHDPRIPAVARQADDLRALAYSAVDALADVPAAEVLGVLIDRYDVAPAWRQLRDDLRRGPVHYCTFHLAQAAPGPERCRELETCLRGLRTVGA